MREGWAEEEEEAGGRDEGPGEDEAEGGGGEEGGILRSLNPRLIYGS